jgi:hypothetical protein
VTAGALVRLVQRIESGRRYPWIRIVPPATGTRITSASVLAGVVATADDSATESPPRLHAETRRATSAAP